MAEPTPSEPRTSFNTHFMRMLLFGLAAAGLVSWFAPKMISWYFQPPVDIGLNCGPATAWSMNRLRLCQFIGFGVGVVGGAMFTFSRGRAKDAA